MSENDPMMIGEPVNQSELQTCIEKGHAEGRLVFDRELADDRYYVIKYYRCSRCNVPISGDAYATPEEEEAYFERQRQGIN